MNHESTKPQKSRMGAGDEKQTTQRDLSDEALAKSDDAKSATDATNCNYCHNQHVGSRRLYSTYSESS